MSRDQQTLIWIFDLRVELWKEVSPDEKEG